MWEETSYLNETYREIAVLNPAHNVLIVQNRYTYKLFVKKYLPLYDRGVYTYLQEHPVANMPQIIELAEEEERLAVIEEYQTGDTLQERMDIQGRFSEEETISLIGQLCTILTDLHSAERPIIHRDIKPSNIILSTDGVLKLIDLSAAKHITEGKTQDTVLLGTAGYAAPEQYGAGVSTVQTDLYAVGILMNVMLCGQLPTIRLAEGRLQPVIRKCLETNPKDRYASAEELRRALGKRNTPQKKAENRSWIRFLPPGLSSHSIWVKLFSALGYALLLSVGLSMSVSNVAGVADLWMNRLFFTGGILMMVLFTGDYLGVQQVLPILRDKKPLLRWLLVILVDFGILFGMIMLLVIFEWMLFANFYHK